jgi:signal transduction histidine kinase
MQERAFLLNGALRIEGIPGAGTTLTLRIPLSRSSPPPLDSR